MEKIQARLKDGKFNMLDLYEQLKSMEGVKFFKNYGFNPGIWQDKRESWRF